MSILTPRALNNTCKHIQKQQVTQLIVSVSLKNREASCEPSLARLQKLRARVNEHLVPKASPPKLTHSSIHCESNLSRATSVPEFQDPQHSGWWSKFALALLGSMQTKKSLQKAFWEGSVHIILYTLSVIFFKRWQAGGLGGQEGIRMFWLWRSM